MQGGIKNVYEEKYTKNAAEDVSAVFFVPALEAPLADACIDRDGQDG